MTCQNVFCGKAQLGLALQPSLKLTYAYLLHSGSQTAAPRHTCLSWSGRGAGLQSGMCYEKRQWSSCTEAAPCLDSPHCAEGWKCRTLDCAWNLWNLEENTNKQELKYFTTYSTFSRVLQTFMVVRGYCSSFLYKEGKVIEISQIKFSTDIYGYLKDEF